MKKERQIGVRVGLPVFFALEVEDIYKHPSGAYRALAFPDFLGFLIGLGLEAYRKQYRQEEAPDIPETGFQGGVIMTGAIHADLIDVKAQVTALANLFEGLTPGSLESNTLRDLSLMAYRRGRR
jgi:hypothetical protein